jgi:hypothetical protein
MDDKVTFTLIENKFRFSVGKYEFELQKYKLIEREGVEPKVTWQGVGHYSKLEALVRRCINLSISEGEDTGTLQEFLGIYEGLMDTIETTFDPVGRMFKAGADSSA